MLFKKKYLIFSSLPQPRRKKKKKDKEITTPSHSPACTCFSECRCALLYLRAIHTITIPMTLQESSVVEWHFLPLKTFGQRPEFWGALI